MNYQYRYGTSTSTAIRTLYNAGKLPRFYSGLLAALIQGPLSRFGDTAANAGILALLQSNGVTKKLPIAVQSAFTSVGAALFRMILVSRTFKRADRCLMSVRFPWIRSKQHYKHKVNLACASSETAYGFMASDLYGTEPLPLLLRHLSDITPCVSCFCIDFNDIS